MYRTPVKQKSAPCRACLHGLWKERTRGPKDRITKRSDINAKALLAKYGGINVESGVSLNEIYVWFLLPTYPNFFNPIYPKQ